MNLKVFNRFLFIFCFSSRRCSGQPWIEQFEFIRAPNNYFLNVSLNQFVYNLSLLVRTRFYYWQVLNIYENSVDHQVIVPFLEGIFRKKNMNFKFLTLNLKYSTENPLSLQILPNNLIAEIFSCIIIIARILEKIV